MTKYCCGLFDTRGGLLEKETIEGKYRTVDAASDYVGRHRDKLLEGYYLCTVTEHKTSLVVYKIKSLPANHGKRLIQMEVAKNLTGEFVNVLVDRTLYTPKQSGEEG